MNKYLTFTEAINAAQGLFSDKIVHSQHWQGVDISAKPEMAMHEVLFFNFEAPMPGEDLKQYQEEIRPNLPWADRHFELERVSGEPINPGETWQEWPYGHSASRFVDDKGQFNHSYAERYWPKYAGRTRDGLIYIPGYEGQRLLKGSVSAIYSEREGIRGQYGDLGNVVTLLQKDPLTRQAYLPVFFPEDTGDENPGRKPCTLGYHFLMRDDELHIAYYIRSCDFIRHFRDDIYLTIRLNLWVLDRLRERDPRWNRVRPGKFLMYISSLHMFRNDFLMLQEKKT